MHPKESPILIREVDFTEVPFGAAMSVVLPGVPLNYQLKLQKQMSHVSKDSQHLIGLAREVFENERKMTLTPILLEPTITRQKLLSDLRQFLSDPDSKHLVLILAGDSLKSGAFVWGNEESGVQALHPEDLVSVWQQSLQMDPEKHLLLFLGFPHAPSWAEYISANGCPHLLLKHFGRPPTGGLPGAAASYSENQLAFFLAINKVSNKTCWLDLSNFNTSTILSQETRIGHPEKFLNQFCIRVSPEGAPDCCCCCNYTGSAEFNVLWRIKQAGATEVHGYCQVRTAAGGYVRQELRDQGRLVRVLDPKGDGHGQYLGEYRSNENCTLLMLHSDNTAVQSLTHQLDKGLELIDAITQRVYPEGREVEFSSGYSRSLPPVFSLLNGPAEYRYIQHGRLLLREKGDFQDGVLHGQGSRVSLMEPAFPAEVKPAQSPLKNHQGDRRKKSHRNEDSDREETETDSLKCHLKYKGQFENGKWTAGVIKFSKTAEFAQFRGRVEGGQGKKATLVGRITLKSGFVLEGRFAPNGTPVSLTAMFRSDGSVIQNATLYDTHLTGEFTCVGEKWTDVVTGHFKNGHLVGQGALFNYEGKFEGTFRRIQPLEGIFKKRGGVVFNYPR